MVRPSRPRGFVRLPRRGRAGDADGDWPGAPNQKRGNHHREGGHHEEYLVVPDGEESQRQARRRQHEGEFADLSQAEPTPNRCLHRPPTRANRQRRQEGLSEHDHDRRSQDEGGLAERDRHVEQHADGREEDSAEERAKRQDVGERLQTVLRFRDDQPSQERPDCQ